MKRNYWSPVKEVGFILAKSKAELSFINLFRKKPVIHWVVLIKFNQIP